MIDQKLLRQDIVFVTEQLKKKKINFDKDQYLKLEESRKSLQIELQDLQNQKNISAKEVGKAKANGQPIDHLIKEVEATHQKMGSIQNQFNEISSKIDHLMLTLPNLPDLSVPYGKDENDNVEVKRWGTPRIFNFTPKDHIELTEKSKEIDFEMAALISGSRFAVLKGNIAKLHRALAQFMMDTHTEINGYTEVNVPVIVNAESLKGTAQLPKFEEDLFKLNSFKSESHSEETPSFYLIPTAEVSLTNMGRDQIWDEKQLPVKLTAHSNCFRSEAGSYGKDTKGLIRQHQFEKVEMVQFVHPEKSFEALDEMVKHAEMILEKLELPYRTVLLCSGDMGFSSAKTFDLEVWLPGQNKYREISSCSNCLDFQARRLHARFRDQNSSKPQLMHTLNGSGLAVGRTLVAVIENYQQEDGSIKIPEVLKPYMKGLTQI